jgi:hypothetical protein
MNLLSVPKASCTMSMPGTPGTASPSGSGGSSRVAPPAPVGAVATGCSSPGGSVAAGETCKSSPFAPPGDPTGAPTGSVATGETSGSSLVAPPGALVRAVTTRWPSPPGAPGGSPCMYASSETLSSSHSREVAPPAVTGRGRFALAPDERDRTLLFLLRSSNECCFMVVVVVLVTSSAPLLNMAVLVRRWFRCRSRGRSRPQSLIPLRSLLRLRSVPLRSPPRRR